MLYRLHSPLTGKQVLKVRQPLLAGIHSFIEIKRLMLKPSGLQQNPEESRLERALSNKEEGHWPNYKIDIALC